MVVGTGMEYFSYNINPTYARERFHEAHDLIVKAWTHDGPFAWEGKHYRFDTSICGQSPTRSRIRPSGFQAPAARRPWSGVAALYLHGAADPGALRAAAAERQYFRECCERAGYRRAMSRSAGALASTWRKLTSRRGVSTSHTSGITPVIS